MLLLSVVMCRCVLLLFVAVGFVGHAVVAKMSFVADCDNVVRRWSLSVVVVLVSGVGCVLVVVRCNLLLLFWCVFGVCCLMLFIVLAVCRCCLLLWCIACIVVCIVA